MDTQPQKKRMAPHLDLLDVDYPPAHASEVDALKAENEALRDALNARHKSMSGDTRERLRKA